MAFDIRDYLEKNKIDLGAYSTTESSNVPKGVSDIRKTNQEVVIKDGKFQLSTLKKVIVEGRSIAGGMIDLKPLTMQEDVSDKYSHVGYGIYKLKGKEKDSSSPTFKKDGDKFIPTKGASKGGDSGDAKNGALKVNIFDKPKTKTANKPTIRTQSKPLEKFIDIASTAKDTDDFITQVRKDTSVPKSTPLLFHDKYGHLNMRSAASAFIDDVKKGVFYNETVNKRKQKIKESVLKENSDRYQMEISKYTGLRPNVVSAFLFDNEIDGKKLSGYVKNGKLKDRLNVVTAVTGKPGNKYEQAIKKQFGLLKKI